MTQSQSKYHPVYHRLTIQPTIMYLVQVDGHTKYMSKDYTEAFSYVMGVRASMGWKNVDQHKRIKITMEM